MNHFESPHQRGLASLFLDLNSYFASVEQNELPNLRGKPVAVVPMLTDSTCAIAASYEAKAYGIKTGTKIYDAKQMCPHLICVLARHNVYVDYHHRVLDAAQKHLPITKIWSIDEFHCELMGREKIESNAISIANAMKQQIRDDVGLSIQCSIGIAPNSFLAKVCSDIKKPNGLVVLSPEKLPGPLFDLQLTDLPGINVNMERRLHNGGIKTIEHLWNANPKHIRHVWGGVQGERFWYLLHGYNVPPTQTKTSMIGHSRVLDPDMRDAINARMVLRRLMFKAVMRLRRTDFFATKLSFGVRILDGYKWMNESQFPAAKDVFTIMEHLDSLWMHMCTHYFLCTPDTMPKGKIFKKISVALHGLKKSDSITNDLFNENLSHSIMDIKRRESLSNAIETINKKYNNDALSLGLVPKTLAGYVGTKIAFSRVPDRDEFLE